MNKISDMRSFAIVGFISFCLFLQTNASFPYYGTKIGALKRLHHGVSGDVYAVDSRTLFIKNFNYDGEAPAAYFYVGHTNKPSNEGAFRLRDERGGSTALTRRYRNKHITLSLPDGKTLRDIKWFSVWCDEFAVNFGDVSIPSNLDFPRPQKINALKGVHGVASDSIVIVDAQTLLVPNFSYDGEAPDAKFWVGRGQRPTPQGLRIPDENGKEDPLRRYDRKTIVLTLPGDLTIFDIGHFGVWCEAFTVDFGHVRVPEGLNVPPSLKMLGISPQSKLNCEVLYDDLAFEVRWAVAGESIVIQLVAKLAENEYMSFGISPNKDRTQMIGSDVAVAWVDKATGKGFAQDYFLDDKSQCSGGRGSCPDINIEENTNSLRLLNAAMVNGYSIVTYQRSLQATDRLDLPISVNGSEAIVWAIGPLNERKETSFHSHYTKQTHKIDFGRQPTWNCPMPEGTKSSSSSDESEEELDTKQDTSGEGYPPASTPTLSNDRWKNEEEEEFYDNRPQNLQRPNTRRESQAASQQIRPVPTPKPTNTNGAWDIPAIQCYEPEDGVFYAQMGPTGGKHGYPAITGHVGWGISWYINGLLIPEIHVVRGKTYTFVVEGGNNPDIPAKYHPFYITDDPVGGYEHKREEEKKSIRIFAGVHRARSGQLTPTGVGRLCNWTPDVDGPSADDYQSFGAYQRTLTLKCDPGEPGVITWKPDNNTPDTVYYHCFTHRYLGWKIHVHDSCDKAATAASEKHEVLLPAPTAADEDITAESSIRHETKVSPNVNFLLMHQTDLIKNHNMNGTPPKLNFEITKSSEITKLISDGIRAAEALEESIIRNRSESGNLSNNSDNKVGSTGVNLISNQYNYPFNKIPSINVKPQSVAIGLLKIPSASGKLPLQPYISTATPEILHGETQLHNQPSFISFNPHSQSHNHSPPSHILHALSSHLYHHPNNFTNLPTQSQKTIGLSEYLRPPQNAPLFHPVKLPGRRPYPAPLKKVPTSKPVLPQYLPRNPIKQQQLTAVVPQSSLIISHYRKPPIPGLIKPLLKDKPFLKDKPLIRTPVLLLGQHTELASQRKAETANLKPIIPVPYSDLVPQDSQHNNVFAQNANILKEKESLLLTQTSSHSNENLNSVTSFPVNKPNNAFKKPFDIHEMKDNPTSVEIATMKPAVNNGFQPDSVVVESGFRPIINRDIDLPEAVDQIAHRREDPGSEIDEVMETDTLFLSAQNDAQTQNFEPMFIPSPPDSTNETIVITKLGSPSILHTGLFQNVISDNMPSAAHLRNSTINELKENNKEKDEDYEKFEINEEIDLSNAVTSRGENDQDNITIATDNEIRNELKMSSSTSNEQLKINFEETEDDEEDKEAQAAERIDTYYLPPDNRKIPETNSGAVITFDGKALIDSSLVLPPKLDARDISSNIRKQHGLSKLEQLVRYTPQFGPFRGEQPPPISEFLSTTASSYSPQLLSSTRPIATKLHLVKNVS